MSTMIFVNLPVKDLGASKAFFEAIGYTINPQFTDETAACVVISDAIFAMILTHAKFKEFTTKKIADATKTCEVMTALSVDSRAAVDKIFDAAIKAGATESRPTMDLGFMYNRAFADLDGHIWEFVWMDPAAVNAA